MARHSGLSGASRAKRMASYLSEGDLNYFETHVAPALEEYYSELLNKGQAPYKSTFDIYMKWKLSDFATRNRLLYSDPEAFVYPPLNKAHKKGGISELRKVFDTYMEEYVSSHNRFIESVEQKLDGLAQTSYRIDLLVEQGKIKPSALKNLAHLIEENFTGRISEKFNRAQKIHALTDQSRKEYQDILDVPYDAWGRAKFSPFSYGYYRDATPEEILDFAKRHNQGNLIVDSKKAENEARPPANKI